MGVTRKSERYCEALIYEGSEVCLVVVVPLVLVLEEVLSVWFRTNGLVMLYHI